MSHKISLFLFMLLAVTITSGCKSGQAKLTAADNGKTIRVKMGGHVSIELEGNPSTGYTWEAKDLDASMLQQVGDVEFKSSNPGLIGSGGSLTLTFKTLKTGTTILNLVYHRPWETEVKPEATFSATIMVK